MEKAEAKVWTLGGQEEKNRLRSAEVSDCHALPERDLPLAATAFSSSPSHGSLPCPLLGCLCCPLRAPLSYHAVPRRAGPAFLLCQD